MARKSKNPQALDQALESATPLAAGDGLDKATAKAMAKVESKKAQKAEPLKQLVKDLDALMDDARDGDLTVDAVDVGLEKALEDARKAEAPAQVIDHLQHALDACETIEQKADHLEEALHVLKG